MREMHYENPGSIRKWNTWRDWLLAATMCGGKSLEKDMKDMVAGVLLQFCDEKGRTCKIVNSVF
jgi:hypothetical protein